MFKKIMIAYDGSDYALKTVEIGFDLAEKYVASVEIIMVFNISEHVSIFGISGDIEMLARDYYDQSMERIRDLFKNSRVQFRTRLLFGHVGQTLVNYAKEQEVDLIIVGARGLSGLKSLVLGSVSQFVFQNSHCAVMVVRRKKDLKKESR